MGQASKFLTYADTIDLPDPCETLIVGPGEDRVDIEYWSTRGRVWAMQPGGGPLNDPECRWINRMVDDGYHNAEYDAIWATHVLEHVRNVQDALAGMYLMLHGDGHLFLAVPPLKTQVVGGHLNLFTMGLLWYHLILAGFDVRDGHYKRDGYNLFAHVQVRHGDLLPELRHDRGDIETLADFWPEGFDAHQGFDGDVREWNWPS